MVSARSMESLVFINRDRALIHHEETPAVGYSQFRVQCLIKLVLSADKEWSKPTNTLKIINKKETQWVCPNTQAKAPEISTLQIWTADLQQPGSRFLTLQSILYTILEDMVLHEKKKQGLPILPLWPIGNLWHIAPPACASLALNPSHRAKDSLACFSAVATLVNMRDKYSVRISSASFDRESSRSVRGMPCRLPLRQSDSSFDRLTNVWYLKEKGRIYVTFTDLKALDSDQTVSEKPRHCIDWRPMHPFKCK